ncbi:MAG: hypothetical protein ACPL4I_11725 [Bacteroidota bacterium]
MNICLFFPLAVAEAQVVVAPPTLVIDSAERFGNFILVNRSDVPQEISISFKFGYPATDSVGNVFMQYDDSVSAKRYSCAQWIRAFPLKFILMPMQQQTVRLMVIAPPNIPDGTYWTRLITSATPQQTAVDTVRHGVTARITFIVQQVTTVVYRKGAVSTGIRLENVHAEIDSEHVKLLARIVRTGNSPFFGTVSAKIYDRSGKLVDQAAGAVSVYFDFTQRFLFDLRKFVPGEYSAEITAISERPDIPKEELLQIEPVSARTIVAIRR